MVRLDFPRCIEREHPETFPAAWAAVQDVLATLPGTDFSSLSRRSPGLQDFGWASYLRCSVVRMARALDALGTVGDQARVLDFGAYFGNFSLACARRGYRVDALDSYRFYGAAMDKVVALLRQANVSVRDADDLGADLSRLPEGGYDAVLCMGVVEHIPHTPRFVLEAIDRTLKPGGLLVLDTPNLAYLYNRQKLARGESPFCPIAMQYETEIPFEGHHREYTVAEVRWMIERLGHEAVSLDTFNYSIYGLDVVQGQDLENLRLMANDPLLREVTMTVSRKPETPPHVSEG